jgi:hypothetical protein
MKDKEPLIPATHEDVCGLHGRFVEAVRERCGDVLRAGHPPDVTLHAHPDGVQCNSSPLGVREDTCPALSHLVPAQE